MNLVVRADASPKIGAGHIMRCFALSQAWSVKGDKIKFVSYCESKNLVRLIFDEGFEFIGIESPHPHPSDLLTIIDLLEQTGIKNNRNSNWLILDGYHFTEDYQKAVQNRGYKLLVIDDNNHLSHYHADILLNQNIHADRLPYSYDSDTIFLAGSMYAILRQSFLCWKNWKREIPQLARKILVTLGGSDPDNVTSKVIEALGQIDVNALEVNVMVGPANPHILEIEKKIRKVQHSMCHKSSIIRIIKNAEVPELMVWADLAITAGGSTCWELAFMGVPILVIEIAGNQREIGPNLEKYGAAFNLGSFLTIEPQFIGKLVGELLFDQFKRKKMSEVGKKLIDGNGVDRIISVLLGVEKVDNTELQ